MKKSDIKVNGEYAYSRNEYGSRDRVRVLGEASISQGYGYGRKSITGSRVQVLESRSGEPKMRKNSETGELVPIILNVANRTLRQEWAPYWTNLCAANTQRLAFAKKAADDRLARSRVLLDLIPALREAGYEDIDCVVNDLEHVAALEAHIEDCVEERTSRYNEDRTETFLVAPLAPSLLAYVARGSRVEIPATDLLRLLQRGNIR